MLRARRGRLGANETELLRQLVSCSSKSGDGVDLRETLHRMDWPSFVESAVRHRLGPLVLRGLRRSEAISATPPAMLERLTNVEQLELARAVVRLHHIDELAKVALERRLDLCLLKGAAFATTLYDDPTYRPMADIDVLVKPSELPRWARVLDALDFLCLDADDHALSYRSRRSGVVVELHRALTSGASYLGLEGAAVIERSVPLETDPLRLRTLSWEDHLLHLCLHASFQHGFRQPAVNAWDARLISERVDFDLSSFVGLAREAKLAPWIYGGLSMSSAVFESPSLAAAKRALADVVPRRVVRKARAFEAGRLLSPDRDATFGPPLRRFFWTGDPWVALALLAESSRPRPAAPGATPGHRLNRILQLVRSQGIQALCSAFGTERGPGAEPGTRFTWRDS